MTMYTDSVHRALDILCSVAPTGSQGSNFLPLSAHAEIEYRTSWQNPTRTLGNLHCTTNYRAVLMYMLVLTDTLHASLSSTIPCLL